MMIQQIELATKFINKFKFKEGGKIIFASFMDMKNKEGGKSGYHGWHTSMAIERAWSQVLSANNSGCGIFFAVNYLEPKLETNPGKKRTKKMVVGCRAIWCEDDEIRTHPRGESEWPIKPSIVVESSRGKYHYYWLTWTENKEEWEQVQMKLVTDWGSDPNVKDLTRVLRLPGTLHVKAGVENPWMVREVEGGAGDRYPWDKVVKAFGKATEEDKRVFALKSANAVRGSALTMADTPAAAGLGTAGAGPVAEVDGQGSGGILLGLDGKRDYKAEIVTGANFHDAFLGYSMGCANRGDRQEMCKAVLIGWYYEAINSGVMNDDRRGRLEDEWSDIDRTIKTGYEKRGEEVESNEQDSKSGHEEVIAEIVDRKEDTGKNCSKNKEMPRPPGLMGDFVDDIKRSMYNPSEIIPVPVALGIVAACGGRVFNVSGGGLNIYTTILMKTGTGKAFISDYISQVLSMTQELNLSVEEGIPFMGASGFTGGKALTDELFEKKSMISVFVEAGIKFGSKAGDQMSLLADVLDLYTRSGAGRVAKGRRYSVSDDSTKDLLSPAFSLINESTPHIFEEQLRKRGSQLSGELPRMAIFKMADVNYEGMDENGMDKHGNCIVNVNAEFTLGAKALEKLQEISSLGLNNSMADGHGDVVEIELPEWFRKFAIGCKIRGGKLFSEDEGSLEAAMLTRAAHKVIKHAALVAVMNARIAPAAEMIINPKASDSTMKVDDVVTWKPVITKEIWDWAIAYHEYEMFNLQYLFGEVDDDLLDLAIKYVGTWMVKYMKDVHRIEPAGRKKAWLQLSDSFNDEIKMGIFRQSFVVGKLRNLKPIKEMNDPRNFRGGKLGVAKLLDVMVEYRMLKRIEEKKPSSCGRKLGDQSRNVKSFGGVLYKIQHEFANYMWKLDENFAVDEILGEITKIKI